MRWAVRHGQDWKVQFWVNQRRKARETRDWPAILATATYGYAEVEKADRIEKFLYAAYDELVGAAPAIINNWRELQDPREPDD